MSYTNPGPSVTTGSTNVLNAEGPNLIGNSDASTVGFYGTAPIALRASSTQATSLVSGVSTGAVSTNSLVLAALLQVMNTLQALGLWKGSA